MTNMLRRLLTRLNILNGARALDRIIGKFDGLTAQLDASIDQLHEEIWAKAEENDTMRTRIRKNLDATDVKRGQIDQASRVRARISEFVS